VSTANGSVYDPASKQTTPAAAPAATTTALAPQRAEIVRLSMDTVQGFEALQRAAKLLCASSLVPERYRGAEGLPNAVIALEMATRIGASPLMAMQHLYVVHGTPGWSAQFVIASVNSCGRFSALRYEWKGKPGEMEWGCRAWTIEKETNTRLDGSWVTLQQVKDQGWWFKPAKGNPSQNTSKWPLMPEQMFMYRAAAYWQRAYAPEVGMGLRTTEEIEDTVIDVTPYDVPAVAAAAPTAAPAPAASAEPMDGAAPAPAGEAAPPAPAPGFTDIPKDPPAEPAPKKGVAAVKAAIRSQSPVEAIRGGARGAVIEMPTEKNEEPAPPADAGERKAPDTSSSRQVRAAPARSGDEFNFDR
jgi:hypothetical protein